MEAFLGHKDVSHTIRRHRGTLAERAPDPRPGRELHQQGPPICAAIRVPNAEIYAIDVSFAALADPAERTYLNQQPTSFVLPAEAVDRLRAAAGKSSRRQNSSGC